MGDSSVLSKGDAPLPVKLQKLIPMLGSPVDGERLAATHAIERAMRAVGLTFHDLAARLSHDGPPAAKVFRHYPAQPDPDDTFMVQILLGNRQLAARDAIFIRAVQSVLDHGHRLTQSQRKRLGELFDALD
jgi:hypothetical protein